MLSKGQERRIRLLRKKKYRQEKRQCLVEGEKLVETAKDFLEYRFTEKDTHRFSELITTQTPQAVAGVANVPEWTLEDIEETSSILVLDGVQDPGNVGAILRACLGFNGSVILVESVDPMNTKVVRSSAGSLFFVPWLSMSRKEVAGWLARQERPILRLEKRAGAISHRQQTNEPAVIVVGSEGSGIELQVDAPSLMIEHDARLESLNVAQAVTIALAFRAK